MCYRMLFCFTIMLNLLMNQSDMLACNSDIFDQLEHTFQTGAGKVLVTIAMLSSAFSILYGIRACQDFISCMDIHNN